MNSSIRGRIVSLLSRYRRHQRNVALVAVAAAVVAFAVSVTLRKQGIAATIQQYLSDDVAAQAPLGSTSSDDNQSQNSLSSTYVLVVMSLQQTLTASDGATYTVRVEAPPEAGIPDDATLQVAEVAPDDATYEAYEARATEALGAREADVALARFFDIAIVGPDGREIQPAEPVHVSIELADAPTDESAQVGVVHFAEQEADMADDAGVAEVVVAQEDAGTTSFATAGFSVYGIVYTVDFHLVVNDQTFEFSLAGGDSLSLRELVDKLNLTEAVELPEGGAQARTTPAEALLAAVQSVTSSNPDLLLAVQATHEATALELATESGHQVVYSLGLTQDEVLALSSRRYEAGAWVLLSLQPFSSEETLTIAFDDGQTLSIRVTDAQDAIMNADGSVQTVANPAGTTIDLFDYWIVDQAKAGRDGWGDLNQGWGEHEDAGGLNGSGNNKGINASTDDESHGHALKFSPAWAGTVYNGTKVGDSGNAWTSVTKNGRNGLNSYTGSGNPFQGIVQSQLDGGYPKLTDNQTIGSNGESLAYLFDPDVEHAGKASYAGVNQLLYVDKEGYYTYDSRDYAAAFNADDQTFTLTEQTSDDSEICGFWPFGTQNFWTGMHLNTQFSMPANGQVLNPAGQYKDMTFEFSGDDDTWLYVDGVLVGDGGGIHNRSEIDINFAKGSVTVTGKKDAHHAGDFEETKWLDDIFAAAGKGPQQNPDDWEPVPGTAHYRFKAGTYHSFDMFYLERGGGESNLYIHYNLVSTADFTAHKSYENTNHTAHAIARDQFPFELVGLDGQYQSVYDPATQTATITKLNDTGRAIMPVGGTAAGAGTVASPRLTYDASIPGCVYTTGVTEDGNVNFGTAEISAAEMQACDEGHPSLYHYLIREVVPDDAVSTELGKTWAEASEAERASHTFAKDGVIYDGTVYYMSARVTSWTETKPNGQTFTRYGLSKTYYTDSSFTTVRDDVSFASFTNRYDNEAVGQVSFTKTKADGTALPGATFSLYQDVLCRTLATNKDGSALKDVASADDGTVTFADVPAGTYYLKETAAPRGYQLDDSVYRVTIVQDGSGRTSSIVAADDPTKTPLSSLVNFEEGALSAIKRWQDQSGAACDPGAESVRVLLKRRHYVASASGGSHSVTVQMSVVNYGNGNQQMFGTPVTTAVQGSTVVIEWDDEWQANFNYTITVGDRTLDGYCGNADPIDGAGYRLEQIGVDGRSRRLTLYNVDGNVSLTTKYHVNWLYTDSNHWANLNRPLVTGSASYELEEDEGFNSYVEAHAATLGADGNWAYAWQLGSGGYPLTDGNGKPYVYYVAELGQDGSELAVGDESAPHFVLNGYSSNNVDGLTGGGVVTIYNRRETTSTSTSITLTKRAAGEDGSPTGPALAGAVFYLNRVSAGEGERLKSLDVTGADTGTPVEVSASDGTFTVPAEGVVISGLEAGEYELVEAKAPEGYLITSDGWTFTVAGDGTLVGDEAIVYGLELRVPNAAGATLPASGGRGSAGVVAWGICLAIAGALYLARGRRAGARV